MVCSGGNKQSILRAKEKKNKRKFIGELIRKPQEEIGGLSCGIFTSNFKGRVVKKVLSPRKKPQTLFSSKSMYFALILLGI